MIPVAIMSLILLVITILLAVADRLLVNYGECRIRVHQGDEEREFTVEGGDSLMSVLADNGVNISSSCGGKGTCGYCKVQVSEGGGQILPTEEVFMSRADKRGGMRLACQVKVKEDVEIHIPDLLATVRNMVGNRLYDPKLRWKWTTAEQRATSPAILMSKTKLSDEDGIRAAEIVGNYRDKPGAIVPILQEISDSYNYLPEPVLRYVSAELGIPLSQLVRVATFYDTFSFEPRGKYLINVCLGTSCHLKGAAGIMMAFEDELGIKAGETTRDMIFTLDMVRCLGCCGLSPTLKINQNIHGLMTRKKVLELIERCRESRDHEGKNNSSQGKLWDSRWRR